MSFKYLGNTLTNICEYWLNRRRDIADDDFFHDYFRFHIAFPEEEKLDGRSFELQPWNEYMVLNPAYGKVWKQVDDLFIKMHPSILKWLENPEYEDTIDGYFSLLEAFGNFGSFSNTTDKILNRLKSELDKTKVDKLDQQTLE